MLRMFISASEKTMKKSYCASGWQWTSHVQANYILMTSEILWIVLNRSWTLPTSTRCWKSMKITYLRSCGAMTHCILRNLSIPSTDWESVWNAVWVNIFLCNTTWIHKWTLWKFRTLKGSAVVHYREGNLKGCMYNPTSECLSDRKGSK